MAKKNDKNSGVTARDVGDAAATVAQHIHEGGQSEGSVWENTKDKLRRYLGALIMERDKETGEWSVSTGKTSWWLAFLPALYIFVAAFVDSGTIENATEMTQRDITPNHLNILLALAAYNFSKKAIDGVKKVFEARKG